MRPPIIIAPAFAGLLLLLTTGCGPSRAPVHSAPGGEPLAAPVAKIVPHRLEAHGEVRIDDYYWLRDDDRDDPEVLRYIEAENAYTEAQMRPLAGFREALYEEIVARIEQDDSTVPYLDDGAWRYRRYEQGGEYPIFCRRRGSADAPEEVLLDANAEAREHDYYNVSDVDVSSGGTTLAYAEDTVGRRIYTIRLRAMATGAALPDIIEGTAGDFVWARDDRTLFYVKREEGTLREFQVWRHAVGTPPSDDALVFHERDPEYWLTLSLTKSKRYVVVASYQTLSFEMLTIPADAPTTAPRVFLPREERHEYAIDHIGDRFYVLTNWQARNFRLMSVPLEQSQDKNAWREEIPARDGVLLEGFELFTRHLVVSERREGIARLRVIPWQARDQAHEIAFDEDVYVSGFGDNVEPDTDTLRFEYTSLTTPHSVFDYDMETRERALRKQERVLGDFDRGDYVAHRLVVTARDGANVPVSIVHRRDLDRSRPQPLLLYGYGAYGYSADPVFRSHRLSLLDRGVIFAIAHVRGGQELGRAWYEDGRLMHKRNTFTDFIDCAERLVSDGWTAPDKLFAYGASAGGLLMGAVANMRPDLFRAIVADVPFVDVLTTMLDETIPLTTFEYDEWGNPNERAYYDYILSYSPYDAVQRRDYPAMLVLSGLHDSQVQYWEPTKWVAKLRALRTDDDPLLLFTSMDAGHSGASGRFRAHRENALVYAFLLSLVGIDR